jgi:class 3 adenylate cyclase
VYRLLLAVDLEKYSHLDAHQQLAAQTDLRRLLNGCAKRTGLRTNAWYRQPGGDGELVVMPAGVDIPRVVGAFAYDLERALAELNGRRPARLRMRLAFHHGTMIEGPLGPAGDAPIVVSRLLDAAPLRDYLTEHPDRDLALVVSDSLFKDVVGSGFCAVNPADFIGLEVEIKEKSYRGHIHHADPLPLTT